MMDNRYCELRSDLFDNDGGAVTEHFGHALHDLGGIITDSDDRVSAKRGRMFAKQLIGVLSGAFAKIGIDRNVAANQRLQGRSDVPDDAARSHNNAAHEAEVFGHAIAIEGERSRAQKGLAHGEILSRSVANAMLFRKIYVNTRYAERARDALFTILKRNAEKAGQKNSGGGR
jgi:hypothetical protein